MLLNAVFQDILALDQQATVLQSQLDERQRAGDYLGAAQVRAGLDAIRRDLLTKEDQHRRLLAGLGGR